MSYKITMKRENIFEKNLPEHLVLSTEQTKAGWLVLKNLISDTAMGDN